MRIRPPQVIAAFSSLGAVVWTLYSAYAEFPRAPATASFAIVTRDQPNNAAVPTLSSAQLDQLLAPIDLYSDALLSQIFLAATHPQDVVVAAHWLGDPEHAQLKGEELSKALQPLPWDPSVKALTSVPRVLMMMSEDVDWMRRLAGAYLAQRGELMGAVERLRHRARGAGALGWGAQTVSITGPTIAIQKSDGASVSEYDPATANGFWPYPELPPYSLPVSVGTGRKTLSTAHSKLCLPETTEAEDFRRLPTGEIVPVLGPTASAGSNLPQTTTSEDFHRLTTGGLALSPQLARNKYESLHVTPQGRVARVVTSSGAPGAPQMVNPPPIGHVTAPKPQAQFRSRANGVSRGRP
jgi:hypothetical protein